MPDSGFRSAAPRRRRWLLFVPFALVVVLAAVWTAVWFYATSRAETDLAAWRQRERQAGRTQTCASQSIGGYPFLLEVRCGSAGLELQGTPTPRPMTHDLVTDMLGELNASVSKVSVTELRENTFYAQITLQVNGSEIEIDSRPSDAIALAVRADAKIFVADEVIDDSAIEFNQEPEDSGEVIDEFKKFLENVTPEDFGN